MQKCALIRYFSLQQMPLQIPQTLRNLWIQQSQRKKSNKRTSLYFLAFAKRLICCLSLSGQDVQILLVTHVINVILRKIQRWYRLNNDFRFNYFLIDCELALNESNIGKSLSKCNYSTMSSTAEKTVLKTIKNLFEVCSIICWRRCALSVKGLFSIFAQRLTDLSWTALKVL